MALTPTDWKAIVVVLGIIGAANIGPIWNAISPSPRLDHFNDQQIKELKKDLREDIRANRTYTDARIDANRKFVRDELAQHEQVDIRLFSAIQSQLDAQTIKIDASSSAHAACQEIMDSLKRRLDRCEEKREQHLLNQHGIMPKQ